MSLIVQLYPYYTCIKINKKGNFDKIFNWYFFITYFKEEFL